MSLTRKIDPETGSYVVEDGRLAWDDTGFSHLYLAIMPKFGSVPGDLTMGCKAWNRTKLSHGTPEAMKLEMKEAAQSVIDAGEADSFEVVYCDIDTMNPNRVNYRWEWTRHGARLHYDGYMAVGTD